MVDRQAVSLYDSADGIGFVVSGTLPAFVPSTARDVLMYDNRLFIRDGNVDDLTLRYKEALTYAMVAEDTPEPE